jgi:hypothetical protein
MRRRSAYRRHGFEMGDEALDTALSTCASASTGC